MKHVFVYDPKCFREQQWKLDNILDSIGQYFRTQVQPDFSSQFTRYPREAIGIIHKRVAEAEEGDTVRIYAIGDSEILFDCLNSIAGVANAELAIMSYEKKPNDFLRIFGEKKAEQFKSLPVIAESPSIPTDIINVGNNYVLNGCFVGLIAARDIRTSEMKMKMGKRLGKVAFFRGLVAFFTSLSTVSDRQIINHHYNITIDGTEYNGNYSFINVANGPFYGGNKIAARGAIPDDGLLDVALMKSTTRLATLFSLGKFSRGKVFPNCIRMQAKKITIQSEEPFWVQMDGEFQQDTSITFEVVPGAVQIVAPKDMAYPKPKS
ncbi:MAG: hypothetical protein LBH97_00995 [Treponema sp.]|jgi:diacylglycerol kinase family enzyme|nr:hypothetical protein [Treponema sp.]